MKGKISLLSQIALQVWKKFSTLITPRKAFFEGQKSHFKPQISLNSMYNFLNFIMYPRVFFSNILKNRLK